MTADLGGTEMEAALRSVFALGGTEVAADVLLITDGEIWNADSLVAAARAAGQRVFTVGIGAAPAEGVLRQLAETTGGACEFVAPDEDAEAGILRMFARLRSPRVDHADVTWPGVPAWVTTTPRGLFGGETIHVFAGFAAAPMSDVAMQLVPAGGGKPLAARATLPAAVDSCRTLARMAAAKRIESAEAESRLALALQYQLLTDATNFIVVHERAEGEKAADLPQLHQVAQMHAAGWGGVGSVSSIGTVKTSCLRNFMFPRLASHGSLEDLDDSFRLDVSARSSGEHTTFDALEIPAFLRPSAAVHDRPDRRASIERLVKALDSQDFRAPQGTLPRSLADLRQLGVDKGILDPLTALVAAGATEETVVRALLEALGPVAKQAGASRQLLRALRNQFKNAGEYAELRAAVATIVAVPMVAGSPAP